ncbi:MAG: GEVED domain-containing protein [Fuerstiella sp.]
MNLRNLLHQFRSLSMEANRRSRRPTNRAATTPGAIGADCSLVKMQHTSVESLEERLLLTIDIQFDYSFDTSGFFNNPDARAVLEQTALDFESRIEDDLLAITPGGVNSWIAQISNPATGLGVSINNLTIPANTILIYVGARDLPSGLGVAGPGGFSSSGTATFNQELQTRGEAGVDTVGNNSTDFAPWGGSVAFDSLVNWHFGLDEPSTGQNDFYSVALHEVAHVLGFGTSDSFAGLINSSNFFVGPAASADFGGPVPVDGHDGPTPDDAHFESGITSLIPGTTIRQESALDPAIATGTRKVLTNLDWAALDDLGWDVSEVASPTDFGDAVDPFDGFGVGNYQTRISDDGPRHTIISGLFIGTTAPDGDDGLLSNATADADDNGGTSDEGFTGSDALTAIAGVNGSIDVNVTHTGTGTATLYGWIDFNGNGEFESGERATATVAAGTDNGTVTLNFPATNAPTDLATFQSILRLRLSTDINAAAPTGAASDGEVEDHAITVYGQEFAYDSLPLFTWPADASADFFELEVNDVTNGQSQIILQSRLFDNSYRPESALTAGRYTWRHRPFSSGSFGAYSALQTFDIFETAATPFITDPFFTAGDSGVASLPTFAWSPYVDAARYEFWLNDVTNGVDRLIFLDDISGTSYTPERAFDAGQYQVFVRAIDSTGAASPWSDAYDFTVGSSAANAGEVTSPVGTSNNGAPTIAFRPTSGTNRLVVTNIDTNEVVVDVDNLSELSYTVPSGLPAGIYEATIFTNGLDAAGESQRFEIQSTAGQIEVTNVRATTTNTAPIIGWNPVDSATRYSIWVNNLSQGITQEFISVNETGTAFQLAGLNSSDTYRVWVRAFNGFTPLTAWSTPVDFTVGEASAIPTIFSPVAETEDTLPIVSWAAVSGAATYEIQISDGTGVIQAYTAGSTSQQLQTPLIAGDYTVTVTARDSAGAVLGADTKNFTVEAGDTTIELFGTDGATENPRPTFAWSSVPGATRYVIWVNDDTNGLTATVFDSEIEGTSFTPNDSLLAGRHRVWVRAFNGTTALTAWSNPSTFIVTESTAAPQIIPRAITLGQTSATTTSTVPAITWNHVAGAASYELQVLDTSGAVLQSVSGITTTTARIAVPPGTFDFRVRSVDGSGTQSAFSTLNRLQIIAADSTLRTELVSPLVRSTVGTSNVLFGWTFPETSGVTYELWVSNLTAGTRPVFETGLTGQSYTEGSLPTGNYRAWVRAVGTGVNGNWSRGVDFVIAAADSKFNTDEQQDDLLALPESLLASVQLPEINVNNIAQTNEAEAGPEAFRTPEDLQSLEDQIRDLQFASAQDRDGAIGQPAGSASNESTSELMADAIDSLMEDVAGTGMDSLS